MSIVLVVLLFSAVSELSADTSSTFLLMFLIPLLFLLLLYFYFFVGSTHRGRGWFFVSAGCHVSRKGAELSCEIYYILVVNIIAEVSAFSGNIHIPWILSAFRGKIYVPWILSPFCGYICIIWILSAFCGNIHVP